jgi:hypothetical protein
MQQCSAGRRGGLTGREAQGGAATGRLHAAQRPCVLDPWWQGCLAGTGRQQCSDGGGAAQVVFRSSILQSAILQSPFPNCFLSTEIIYVVMYYYFEHFAMSNIWNNILKSFISHAHTSVIPPVLAIVLLQEDKK